VISLLSALPKAPQVLVPVWTQPNFQPTGHTAAVAPWFIRVLRWKGFLRDGDPASSGEEMATGRTVISGLKYMFWPRWRCRIPVSEICGRPQPFIASLLDAKSASISF